MAQDSPVIRLFQSSQIVRWYVRNEHLSFKLWDDMFEMNILSLFQFFSREKKKHAYQSPQAPEVSFKALYRLI